MAGSDDTAWGSQVWGLPGGTSLGSHGCALCERKLLQPRISRDFRYVKRDSWLENNERTSVNVA